MREAILSALAGLLAADGFFPAVAIDAPEPEAFVEDTPGLPGGLSHFLALQDPEELVVTRDAGPEDDCELRGEWIVAYIVQAAPAYARVQRARRRTAERKVADLIAADRTLGLNPEVYAELGPATRHNAQPVNATSPCATTLISIFVDFTAPSAAG
jgi:hypothetical protein